VKCKACTYPIQTKSCQICGYQLEIDLTKSTLQCPRCKAVYDVIRHGSVSPERALTGKKYETYAGLALFDETWTRRIEDTTQFVGTRILLVGTLHAEPKYTCYADMEGLSLDVYHRLNTGPWEKIRTVKLGVTSDTGKPAACGIDVYYTLAKPGTHTFQLRFAGTDKYAGCPPVHSKIHGFLWKTNQSISPEKGVLVQPALTVQVKDLVTGAPIVNAEVKVDRFTALTDPDGKAVFTLIPTGTYRLKVTKDWYIEHVQTIILTEAGLLKQVHLIPIWIIPSAIAIIGGGIILIAKLIWSS